MIQELLVIIACTHNSGCTETMALYYTDHPGIEKLIDKNKRYVNKTIGPEAVFIAPYALVAAGGQGSFRLNKYMSVKLSRNTEMIVFRLDF